MSAISFALLMAFLVVACLCWIVYLLERNVRLKDSVEALDLQNGALFKALDISDVYRVQLEQALTDADIPLPERKVGSK